MYHVVKQCQETGLHQQLTVTPSDAAVQNVIFINYILRETQNVK